MNNDGSRKSGLPGRVGIVLAVLGALSAVIVAAGLAAGPGAGFPASAGRLLTRPLGWAALCLPVFLFAASGVLFLPGYRKDLLVLLSGAPLPFLVLVFLARFLAEPGPWYDAYPLLEALGLPGTTALGVLVLLLSITLLVRLKGLAGRGDSGTPEAEEDEEGAAAPTAPKDAAPRAPAARPAPSVPDGSGSGRSKFVPLVPEPGEPPFPSPGLVPPAALERGSPGGSEDALSEFEEEAALEELEGPDGESGGDRETEPPIPVLFRRTEPEPGPKPETASSARPPLLAGVAADPTAEAEMRPSRGSPFGSGAPGAGADADGAAADGSPVGRHPLPVFESVPPSPRRAPKTIHIAAYSMPTDILTVYPDGQYWVIDDKTRRSADVLRDTLAEFNIEAEVTGIRRGPVVTMFEILPAPGVKLSKIVNLSDNIALRLAASSVRIVAPIPGKHAVGIEVPNDKRSVVSFREIVETDVFRAAKFEIPLALGKDIAGEVQIIDLTQMPHLLIAGATGSGKSVLVNSIILSILYRKSWNEVKLLLIDPKIVELKLYNGIPHLLTPVVTEPKRAFQALQYCICEMERRYSLLDGVGVRDIKSYNRRIKEREFAAETMPYIVVVIDEFADLMATTGKELESTLARLAAMSRAVGIHLVLATQRPSIDVITGLIKANIPSRVAFMVASKFDSRIIIDAVGAEKLLGKGDMLVSTAQDAFPVRMQGAFVSEEEVERVVGHVKTLGQPDYIDDEIFFDEDEEDGSPSLFDDEGDDPLFEKALEIVLQQGKASASYLQRRLKIGYNRAARLVEMMEEKGIVGPSQGSKPRDVMRNPEVAGRPDAGRSVRPAPDSELGFGPAGPDGDAGGDTDGEG
ncbi:MAG TPA: DNA translocase FtsK [Spirochaetales bacterium]|nr:DNA translocase FtsK [Spirochaetales bacterium]